MINTSLDKMALLYKEAYSPNPGDNLPYIGLEHIEQQTLQLSGIGTSDSVISGKSRFYSGDILFGKLRPYFRKVYRPKFDGVCSTDIWVVRARPGFDQGFLFYFLANNDFIDLTSQGSTGTRMPRADWSLLKSLQFEIPDYTTQQRIGEILTSLDDKIELNRQMNQTLEEIAAAMFKHYFEDSVDEDNLPEGWELKKLREEVDIKHGYAFKGEFFSEAPTGDILVTPGNFRIGGGFNFGKYKYYKGAFPQEYVFQPEDLMVTMTDLSVNGDTLGYSALAPSLSNIKLLHNQRIGKVRFNTKPYLKHYLHWLMRTDRYRNFVLGSVSGTTVKHTSPSRISDYQAVIPSEVSLKAFNSTMDVFYQQEQSNVNENLYLEGLRDHLLPKLISGEIMPAYLNQLEEVL